MTFLWLGIAVLLFGGSLYFQTRCAEIEGELKGEEILCALIGNTWFRGSTKESRDYRLISILMVITGVLSIVEFFRLLALITGG